MRFFIVCLLPILLFSDDYSFDMDDIEVKTYEYAGYIKAEEKYQKTISNNTLNNTFLEAQLAYKYFKDKYSVISEFQVNHSNINDTEKNIFTTNQLYLDYKLSSNHSFYIGKQSLKWGKGYFFNPIAVIDRIKDPNNPEASKEGYIMANYKYNKSYIGNLKNFTLDIVYVPTSKDLNSEYYDNVSNILAVKSYFLYFDTDIDILYFYNDILKDKVAVDFSKNLEENFEIHGEFLKEIDGYSSYLFGLKYLTSNDITITTEYFYRSITKDTSEAFYDNKYLLNKFSIKEPFSIVYSSIYFKNTLNLQDKSQQNNIGGIYSFKNNISLDISYIKNSGDNTSEFGMKQVNDTIYAKISWYF